MAGQGPWGSGGGSGQGGASGGQGGGQPGGTPPGGANGGGEGGRGGPQRPTRPWGAPPPPPPEPERPRPGGPRRPGQPPELDAYLRKGQERLRVLMGGRGGRPGTGGPTGPGGGFGGFGLNRNTAGIVALAAAALWAFASFYTVTTGEKSVELLFGRPVAIGEEGLNFAPFPFVTREIVNVTEERVIEIGTGREATRDGRPADSGLMLTRDQNIVDIAFQVVWNISEPQLYLFNLADPEGTIRAVAESAMRDIVARSELAPILNRDRGVIAKDLEVAIQRTLDSYNAGINIARVNLGRADPPGDVIDAFRDVQAAQQERDRLEKEADAYANRVMANARGEAAALVEQAEAYRAQAVNEAEGAAARFNSVYEEYVKAPDVTRRRMYLETMEKVLGDVNKVIIDGTAGGAGGTGGVVPYLPLDRLARPAPAAPVAAPVPGTAGTGVGTGAGVGTTTSTDQAGAAPAGGN